MAGNELDNMTNKELYEHFEKMVSTHAEDVEKKVGGAMEKIADLEGTFNTKFDNINTNLTDLTGKFDHLLEGLKPPRIPGPVLPSSEQPRARRVLREEPQGSTASAAAPVAVDGVEEEGDGYATDGGLHAHPRGRPVHILTATANTLRCATMNM